MPKLIRDKEAIADRIRQGEPAGEVAKKHGVHLNSVYSIARSRRIPIKRKKTGPLPENLPILARMREGIPTDLLVGEFGRSVENLRRLRAEYVKRGLL